MSILIACAAGVSMFVYGASGASLQDGSHSGYLDGLVFSLGIKGSLMPGDSSTYANVYDEMTQGSVSPLVVTGASTFDSEADPTTYQLFGTPDPICVTNDYIVPSAYPWTSNVAECVYFPAPLRVNEDPGLGAVSTNCFPQTVRFGRSVPTGSNVTYFIRFRWDGNLRVVNEQTIFANGMNTKGGFGLRMYHDPIARTSDVSATKNRIIVANGRLNFAHQCKKGRWYDYVVRMKWSEDCDGAGTPGTVIDAMFDDDDPTANKTRRTTLKKIGYVANRTCATAASTSLPIYLGQGDASLSKWEKMLDNEGSYAWRGAVAKLQIYDRALSDAEMFSLFSIADGTMASAGSENGSSDEFGTSEGAAEVYDPNTMPMRKMLGSLSEDSPSLSFKFPLREEERRLPMVLRLATIPDGVGSTAFVQLSVNGVPCEALDFAKVPAREFCIPARMMVTDNVGDVTMTLSRIGRCTGTLKVDAFKLFGSWQVGKKDVSNNDWCFKDGNTMSAVQWEANSWGFVGSPANVARFVKTLWGLKSQGASVYLPQQTLAFYLSSNMASSVSSHLTFSKSNLTQSYDSDIGFYTNGAFCKAASISANTRDAISVDFPPGSLNPGINYIVISNATHNEPGWTPQYRSVNPDYYSFRIDLPPRGMMIIMR